MPGPAMHQLIAARFRDAVGRLDGVSGTVDAAHLEQLRKLLADPKNLPYYLLGCQGPDFFFFNAKDMAGSTLGKLATTYYDVYDEIEKFKGFVRDAIPQPVIDVLEAAGEVGEDVIESSSTLSELQQLFGDVNNVLEGGGALVLEMVKKYITDFDLYGLMSHPYRDGAVEGDWWWFDAMHYRKTGRYAAALLEATRDPTPLHLYALGYLTHVGADTVGHAYVNLVSGGPYRSHAQRHKTLENYQDVMAYAAALQAAPGLADWNHSRAHALYNFNFDGVSLDPDANTELPDDLAALIAGTLREVYQEDGDPEADYAKNVTAEDVNDTYRTWHRWLRSATEGGTLPPPVPYSFSAELEEIWEKALDNLGAIGDYVKGATGKKGKGSLWSILKAIARAVVGAFLAAAALADAVLGLITTLGSATIRAAACLIYEQLYNAYQNFRLGVALNGLAFPLAEHLHDPRFAQFVNPGMPDPLGVRAGDVVGRMPVLRVGPGDLQSLPQNERHLVYPTTAGEKVSTNVAPPQYLWAGPLDYAFGPTPLDPTLLDDLVALTGQADRSEAALQALFYQQPSKADEEPLRKLGNALDLTGALYGRWYAGKPLPDFNLDADRGYGYLCWTQPGDPPNFPDLLKANADAADPTEVQLEVLS